METTNTAIITVVGRDKVGIIATVSAFLSERGINIEDISQTILSGNFVMMMSADIGAATESLTEINAELQQIAGKLGVSISVMHEKVFGAMHRI
jgi:ACT domain-containing protein